MIHAYFYSLPMHAVFYHKQEKYIKIKEERVRDESGKEWLFEGHYGCLVDPLLEGLVTERPLV